MTDRYPKNPTGPEEVLQINDIQPGVAFGVFDKDGLLIRGVVETAAEYTDDGWLGATAVFRGLKEATTFDVLRAGIVPSSNGTWADAETYTVPDDSSNWE